MRLARRVELADLICEHRRKLEASLLEVASRGTPMTEAEALLLVEAADRRLTMVETELRHARRRILGIPADIVPLGALIRFAGRLRGLLQPRLGRLYHYPPRPLDVPAGYWSARAPHPAPTISIVTPSFQQGRFIERTIGSVVSQGYPALEYVVQDGGSTDETLDVLRRCDGLVSRWASEPDNGHADALNRGFRDTTGEIMSWLNSDDLLLPGALAHVASHFATHPETDVVYGNRIMIDAMGRAVGAWILPAHDDLALTLADYVPQETLFFRRSIWDAAGGALDDTFTYAIDWDLLLRFREAGARMVRLPRFLGAFRVHAEQRTSVEYAVGLEEMSRLRERVHGRPVPLEEVNARLRPYLRRHVRAHLAQRCIDRLPGSRLVVEQQALVAKPLELALRP